MSVSAPVLSRSSHSWRNLVCAFDTELAQPQIEGVSIGSTLTDPLVIDFINGGGRWGIAQLWLDRLRRLRQYCRSSGRSKESGIRTQGRILVAWRSSTARIDDLILPVVEALSADRCTMLYNDPNVLRRLPSSADAVDWMAAVSPDRSRWQPAFRRCWPQWRSRLQSLSKSFGLPRGAVERLSLNIIVNSRIAVGSLAFLERCRPAAIVTDYDRARFSSCLVLAARSLGIPAFSLQHGVLDCDAVGYVPVIADRMFCWGELHRRIMGAAGQDPARLAIGGCPRLTRDLPADPEMVRSRWNIDPSHRVALLGTSPIPASRRALLAECFCRAVHELAGVSGIVRLHPSESLEFYAAIAKKYPRITFLDNRHVSLDESLAATDIVVVQNSGLGSDALVKRRLVVVVDIPDTPLGHGMDLVEKAGCPCVKSPGELAQVIGRLFSDEEYRRAKEAAAERFVETFCASYGAESARQIAETIRQVVGRGGAASSRAANSSDEKAWAEELKSVAGKRGESPS